MKTSLQSKKQQAVREAIFDAAIDLFAEKGFDQTTVEEVATAAGVSRRSFFRYYASKDDLLAHSMVNYGLVLKEAIEACPSGLAPSEVVRETVMAGIRFAGAQTHLRKIIEIAARSPSARQAHLSRMMEVEDAVAQAYAGRFRNAAMDDLKPRLLASMTLSIMSTALVSWFKGEYSDLPAAAKQVFANLTRFLSENK